MSRKAVQYLVTLEYPDTEEVEPGDKERLQHRVLNAIFTSELQAGVSMRVEGPTPVAPQQALKS